VINLGRLGFADEPVVTELAASSLAIALGDEFPADAGELEKMDDPKVVAFVPPSWRAKGDAGYWAKALLPYRKELGIAGAEGDGDALAALIPDLQARREDERRRRHDDDEDRAPRCSPFPTHSFSFFFARGLPRGWRRVLCARLVRCCCVSRSVPQNAFVEKIAGHEQYGAHFFITHKLDYPGPPAIVAAMPKDLTIAFNAAGMFVFDSAAFLKVREPYFWSFSRLKWTTLPRGA
jgi:hypothetical protein